MKMFLLPFALFFIISSSSLHPQDILWWFDTNDSAFGQSSAGDLNGDGYLDIVFGCYRNDSCIYALSGLDGKLLWKYNAAAKGSQGCNDVATLIYDLDGDKFPEVIVPSSCNPTTFCFNGIDGSLRWTAPTRGSDSPPSLGNIDGDGKLEVIHGQFWDYLICLDALSGERKWEIQVQEITWIQTAPTLVDLDSDGILDIVVATWCLNKGDTNRIYAYRGYDQKLLWKKDLNGVVYHGTAVVDINGDNKPDLVIGDYGATLHALDGATGGMIWTFTKPDLYYIGSPAVVADLNGDGSCEIIFTSAFQVTVLNLQGAELWSYWIPKGQVSFRGVALSDLNNDGLPDIVFASDKGQVYVLQGTNGSVLYTYDLAEHIGKSFDINHAPLIADFNKDGIKDVFVVGGFTDYPDVSKNYGRAYLLSANKGKGPDWLMFQNNIRRDGSLCKKPVSVNEVDLDDFIIINNKSDELILNFNTKLDDNKDKLINIYDILGNCVLTTSVNATILNHNIEISNLSNGVYYININKIFKKIIVIK